MVISNNTPRMTLVAFQLTSGIKCYSLHTLERYATKNSHSESYLLAMPFFCGQKLPVESKKKTHIFSHSSCCNLEESYQKAGIKRKWVGVGEERRKIIFTIFILSPNPGDGVACISADQFDHLQHICS